MTPLTCRELVALGSQVLEGAPDPGTARALAEHLAGCPGCEAFLEQLRQVVAAAADVPEHPLDDTTVDRLLRALRAGR